MMHTCTWCITRVVSWLQAVRWSSAEVMLAGHAICLAAVKPEQHSRASSTNTFLSLESSATKVSNA